MYSKWLDEDNEELDISTEELESLKNQFKEVQDTLGKHSSSLEAKESSLEEKEKRLKVMNPTTLGGGASHHCMDSSCLGMTWCLCGAQITACILSTDHSVLSIPHPSGPKSNPSQFVFR